MSRSSTTPSTTTTTDEKQTSDPLLHPFQRICTDALTSITHFCTTRELATFMQLNHASAHLLTRPSAYHQRRMPAFQRHEFNLYQYHKWMESREPLVITSPNQLLEFSRSRVLTHLTDVELRLDEYCQHPTSPPPDTPTGGWFSSSSKIQSALINIRTTISRFQNVRSLKVWFRPTTKWNTKSKPPVACFCMREKKDWLSFKNWFIAIVEICLEVWSSRLISLELEVHHNYRCILPASCIESSLPLLTSLQHLQLIYPTNSVHAHYFNFDFQFTDKNASVVVFQGGRQFGNMVPSTIPRPPCNASHIIWLPSPRITQAHSTMQLTNIFQYLHQTKQLITNGSSGPYQPDNQRHGSLQPLLTILRQQLRTLWLNPAEWALGANGAVGTVVQELAYMRQLLELMIQNFAPPSAVSGPLSRDSTPGSLQSLYVLDGFSQPHSLFGVEAAAPIPYADYLARLRHDLRILKFYSTIETHRSIDWTEEANRPCLPPLPIELGLEYPSPLSQLVWPLLESFVMRLQAWESLKPAKQQTNGDKGDEGDDGNDGNDAEEAEEKGDGGKAMTDSPTADRADHSMNIGDEPRTHPPLTHEIFWAMERVLPRLDSLGLSVNLLPTNQQPLTGILLRIKHLHLYGCGYASHYRNDRMPEWLAYRDCLSSTVTTIALQLRQLESLHLNLFKSTGDALVPWTQVPFYECLLPLVLSSSHLRTVSIDAPQMIDVQFHAFVKSYQKHLFRFYALWCLLQPSFQPPTDYNDVKSFLFPILDKSLHPLYMYLLGVADERVVSPSYDEWDPPPLPTDFWDHPLVGVSDWFKKVQTDWHEWRHKEALNQRQLKQQERMEAQRTAFESTRHLLQPHMTKLLEQHPSITFEPRTFTLQLQPAIPGRSEEHPHEYLNMIKLMSAGIANWR